VTAGAVVSDSIILIVNDFVEVFPSESVAAHVTVVVPIGKTNPDIGTHVTSTSSSISSVAVTVKSTINDWPVASLVMSSGTVISGASISIVLSIVTANISVVGLPAASVAVHVTVVVCIYVSVSVCICVWATVCLCESVCVCVCVLCVSPACV